MLRKCSRTPHGTWCRMKFISCWASPVKHLHAYMQPLKIPFFYEHCLCHYHRHCLCYCHNHWHLRCNFFLISRHGHWLSLLSYCHRQCFFSATVLVIVRAVVTLLPLLLLVWLLLHFHRLCHSASMSVCLFDCLFVCLCDCQCHWSLYTVSLTVCHCHSLWVFVSQLLQCDSFQLNHYHFYFYVTINVTTSLTVIIIVTIAILWKSLSLSLLQ